MAVQKISPALGSRIVASAVTNGDTVPAPVMRAALRAVKTGRPSPVIAYSYDEADELEIIARHAAYHGTDESTDGTDR